MSKANLNKFEDDKHVVIDDDIKRLQKKSGMYIANKGGKGALHLGHEDINNHIDECTNSKSPGRNIEILLDEVENVLMTSDDGRGIPFDKLEVLCTVIQSSSKMDRSGSGGSSAGENGVGMTAINALSERFESISTRYGEEASVKFEEGRLVQPLTIKKIRDKEKHGQTFIFKPSDRHLSVEDDPAIIDRDELEKWVRLMSYLVPPSIKMRFDVSSAGGKMYSKKYQNKEGMKTLLTDTFKKTTDPLHVVEIMHFKEKIINDEGKEEMVDRYTAIEVALAYSNDDSEEYVDSFCNFVNTIDGGTHVNAVQGAVFQVLKEATEKTMSETQAKNLTITNNDVRSGLKMFLYARTSTNPQFSGQVKEKVNSQVLYKQIRPMVVHSLRAQLKANEKLTKKITDAVKTNARARIAADKAKEAVIKRSKTENLDQYDDDKFIPCSASENEYREVLVMEGDSASASFKSTAYTFQAAMKLRGVSLNAYKANKQDVMDNKELRTFIKQCGTGIGPDFKLENFAYTRVVMMTDGDSDGGNIFSGFTAFLIRWMRPLVEAGRVYRLLPPLYKIADKNNPFIKNRKEYFDIYVKNVLKNIKVGSTKTGMLSKEQFSELLELNRDYLEELDRMVRYFGVHPDVLECILFNLNSKDFSSRLNEALPEMVYDGKVVRGVYNGKYQYIKIGKRFRGYAEVLLDIINQNNSLHYKVFDKMKNEVVERGEYTIGGLLKTCLTHKPKIIMRYKGLGELDEDDFKTNVLDPNNRIIVKLTVSDIEKMMETAEIFHGKESWKRQEANSHFRIRRDELDN